MIRGYVSRRTLYKALQTMMSTFWVPFPRWLPFPVVGLAMSGTQHADKVSRATSSQEDPWPPRHKAALFF